MTPWWRSERLRLALAALLLVLGFARPTLLWKRALFEHVVVLDVTQSMNVEDMQLEGKPAARLAFAKRALHEALSELPCGSRLGWAIFTEYRTYLLYTPVEVCANRAELRASLASLDGRMAWSGNSEIAKGLHSSLLVAKALPGTPSVVFISDGHEAPPLHPRHRPHFDDKPGEVAGVLVGVGELKPSPIPKLDPLGRRLGFWAADEVAQTDLRSQGRGASVGAEAMTEEGSDPAAAEHAQAWRERCVIVGGTGLLPGALGHVARPINMMTLLQLLDGLMAARSRPRAAAAAAATASASAAASRQAILR